jgi:uncharacterized protein Smg (DUF494 family)
MTTTLEICNNITNTMTQLENDISSNVYTKEEIEKMQKEYKKLNKILYFIEDNKLV